MKRATRSKYRVGQEVELMSTSVRKITAGTITATSVHLFTLELHSNVIADTLYRVEVKNGNGAFGHSTRYVWEKQVRGLIEIGKAA